MGKCILERALLLGLIFTSLNTLCYAVSIDGNDSNGIINIHDGTYGDIIGKGAVISVSKDESKINENANVTLTNVTANRVFGGASYTSPVSYDMLFVAETNNNFVSIYKSNIDEIYGGMATVSGNINGGYSKTKNNQLYIESSEINDAVYGQMAVLYPGANNSNMIVEDGKLLLKDSLVNGEVYGNVASVNISDGNILISNGTTTIENSIVKSDIYSAYTQSYYPTGDSEIKILDNSMIIKDASELNNVYGACAYLQGNDSLSKIELNGNEIVIENGIVKGNLYLAYVAGNNTEVDISNNSLTVKSGANLEKSNIYGYYTCDEQGNEYQTNNTVGNTFIVEGWKGKINSINNFNNIKFQNIDWENEGIVVEVLNNNAITSLENTKIDLRDSTTLSGGTSLKKNDYMYFIKSANGSIGTNENNILVNQDGESDNIFIAGVALEGTGKVEVEADGSVKYTITDVNNTDQIDFVPVNSSLAAAFVINGSDLVVDGLNAMEQDQLFGVKTFAIVEGYDSSYDVADDLKVNGWNGLYGVGNIKEYKDGNLSYAAFFENGTANYRTFNSFMDEVIRGDGSIVYNGGGIAGRYKKDNGFYTEASLRAGLLKNELKNMFKDGNGSIYGYKTESPYYAFHLGIGKVIDIKEDRDLDLYARYYHTYNDGDNFTVAGDVFEVDSITSDKVRIGTRYNVNNDKDISTYYGLAWEYEFNGDADVRVNGQKLPGETLQGSSGFAEIGFVQRNSSPWSFEGRVRGYVGEREGVSGLLRATYSF